jgi:hypothetical protein
VTEILSVHAWRDNADMIATAVAPLGYIGADVLDLSYGLGNFWTDHRLSMLTANDVHPAKGDHSYSVYDDPPGCWVGRFATTVWDGPYKLSGRPALGEFDERYGVDHYQAVESRMGLLRIGAIRAVECTRPGGTVLIKCQSQIVSGRRYNQIEELTRVVEAAGARYADEFHLTYRPRPQPPGRRQVHARSNSSCLLVFRKPVTKHERTP